MTKKTILLGLVPTALVALIVWIAWGNQALELNLHRISGDNLPGAFDGFRIAHLSDLHNSQMGRENEKLISMLESAAPDIIVITGDMIDSRDTHIDIALAFAEKAVQIAPCYYVAGNHEARIKEYSVLKEGLSALGVAVLEDAKTKIVRSGEAITIMGVSDPSFQAAVLFADDAAIMNGKLDALMGEDDGYRILLSHRPELFAAYVEKNVDLVFSGHAHGGQFRLPFLGGVVAPHQGLFPKYDAGVFIEGNTHLVVSRGVGNSIVPFRVNNRPEVVLIELIAQRGE